jgi:hypothetical protein
LVTRYPTRARGHVELGEEGVGFETVLDDLALQLLEDRLGQRAVRQLPAGRISDSSLHQISEMARDAPLAN